MRKKEIVEQKLGIPPDYQYKAIKSKNFFQSNWHRNKFNILKKYIQSDRNKTYLDLGPGSGNFESMFSQDLKKIVAIDYNDQAVKFVKKRMRNENIRNVEVHSKDIRDIENMHFKEKFDGLVIVDVIEHISLKDARKLVKRLKKILKKGAKIYVITPNYKSTWLLIERILDNLTIVPKFNNEQHLAKYYKENLHNLFTSQGMSVDFIKSFNLFSYMMPSRLLSKLLLQLELSLPIAFGNLLIGVFTVEK